MARNLRAYITTLLGSLQCHTDVQATDGRATVLRYASSYVSKCHSGSTSEILHSHDLSGFQAANSFLITLRPLEPEMVLSLTSMKMAWIGARTKWITVSYPDGADSNTTYLKYLSRPASEASLNFLEWLRKFDDTKIALKVYKTGSTLVGVKMVSVFILSSLLSISAGLLFTYRVHCHPLFLWKGTGQLSPVLRTSFPLATPNLAATGHNQISFHIARTQESLRGHRGEFCLQSALHLQVVGSSSC